MAPGAAAAIGSLGGMLGGLGLGSLAAASTVTPCGGASMSPSAFSTAGTGMITFSAPAGTVFMLCAQ